MKNLRTYILKPVQSLMAAWIILAFTSCRDNILDESPRDVIAENYYHTASAELETAVNATDSPLRTAGLIGNYLALLDAHRDCGFGRGSRALFNDHLINKRFFEFIFEGTRWFTLKRTDKATELILANRGKLIAEKHYLWPIPLSELNFNDAINAEHQNQRY